MVKESKADIEKRKELNELENQFIRIRNLPKDALQLENLRHEGIAQAKLIEDAKRGNEEALEYFGRIMLSTTTNKQRMRNLAFRDDINGDIAKIETNFNEAAERRRAKIQAKKALRKQHRVLYSDGYDDRFEQKARDREDGLYGEYDKFGNPNRQRKVDSDLEEYSSHSSDAHTSDEDTSSASSFDSQASRINFWRDINTKDDEYTNAIIVSKNDKGGEDAGGGDGNFLNTIKNRMAQEEQKKQMLQTAGLASGGFGLGEMGPPLQRQATNISKQAKHELKAQTAQIKNYAKDVKTLQGKVEKMKQSHELEKKNIKNVALTYAIDYFKKKTKDLVTLFTNEGMKMLTQYSFLREQLFQRDDMLKRCARYSIMQEDTISELRSFIERNFADVVKAMRS